MKISGRTALALMVGSLLVGSIVSVAAQEAQESTPAQPGAQGDQRPMKHAFHGPGPKGGIRSESVFRNPETNAIMTVRHDNGILQDVDGSTLVIKEDDGTTVRVATNDDTRIRREGSEAKRSDLKNGDHVSTIREKTGDADFVTRGVHAISAERWTQMEQQREACRQDRTQCPDRRLHMGPKFGMRGPRFGFGPGGPALEMPVPAPDHAPSNTTNSDTEETTA